MDRVFVRLSAAALLVAGMWMVVLAGAGTAAATTDSDSGASASSQSAGSTGAKSDPDKSGESASSSDTQPGSRPTSDQADDRQTRADQYGSAGTKETSEMSAGSAATDDSSDLSDEDVADASMDETIGSSGEAVAGLPPFEEADTATLETVVDRDRDRDSAAEPKTLSAPTARVPSPVAALSTEKAEAETSAAETGEVTPETTATVTEVLEHEPAEVADNAPSGVGVAQPAAATFALVAADSLGPAEATAANPPTVLDLIGTVFFSVFTAAFQLFQGPPQLPPGSTVTVRTSTLELRPGYEVPADWYVPENPDPDRLIYFQHGFITNARTYSYTIAALAEETNSIVIAPSITSNFFATDAFWLAGKPMQEAIANLFVGDREALTDSATRALGYDVMLPQRVVLLGHSYGAQAVVGAVSYMEDATIGDVAGIVLLDGVSEDPAFSSLDGVPTALPVYNLSSPDGFLSGFGAVSNALANARPGAFNGFQLVGGSHVDAMRGGNPIIQLIADVALGSRPENVAAVDNLIAGWVNDMFDPATPEGVYAAPGTTIEIPTDAGIATAISVPVPSAPLGILEKLVLAFGNFAVATFYNFEPTEGGLDGMGGWGLTHM